MLQKGECFILTIRILFLHDFLCFEPFAGSILETCKSWISGTHPFKFDEIFRNDFTILTLRKGCIIDPEPAHHRENGKISQRKFENTLLKKFLVGLFDIGLTCSPFLVYAFRGLQLLDPNIDFNPLCPPSAQAARSRLKCLWQKIFFANDNNFLQHEINSLK